MQFNNMSTFSFSKAVGACVAQKFMYCLYTKIVKYGVNNTRSALSGPIKHMWFVFRVLMSG